VTGARPGFALVYVISVAMIVSLVITATLTRQDAQARFVHRQRRAYQARHDMLGARAVVELWLNRTQPADLATIAREPGPHYTFDVPGVMRLEATLSDGQGLPLADETLAPASMRDTYRTLLERLPADRAGLVRASGPARFSAATAPREVLAALLPDADTGERFADDIVTLRERDGLDEQSFFRVLSAAPDGDSLVLAWRPIVTFQPTVWRLQITVTDSRGEPAVFGLVAERDATEGVTVLESLTEADLNRLAAGDRDRAGEQSEDR